MRSRTPRRLSTRARDAGVDADRHDRHRASTPACARSSSPSAHDGVFAALGIDPHQAAADEAAARRRARVSCSRTRERSRSARRASTTTTAATGATSSAASSRRSSSSRPSSTCRSSIHYARRRRGHRGAPRGFRRHRRPALLLGARPPRRRARARLVRLVRRQRHLPEGGRAARGRRAGARRPDPRRDRQPVPRAAAAFAAGRNEPANVVHTVAVLAAARGEDAGGAGGADRRERDGGLPLP